MVKQPTDQRSLTLTLVQESPHEHQQSLLLSRIITNVVRSSRHPDDHPSYADELPQEKLNEAVMVLNKSLQVRRTNM